MKDETQPGPQDVANDKHLHRRASENNARRHARRFDSTRAQIIGMGAALVVLGGTFAGGYAVRDAVRTVEGTPGRWQEHLEAEAAQWEAITSNTQGISNAAASRAELTDRLDFALSLLAELRCMLNAQDAPARARCRDDETERRLEEMRARRQTP